jgi:hypothetical protein
MLFMANRGSSPDLIARICLFLVLIVFAAQLLWQERRLKKALRSGISCNKAVFPVLWRPSIPVLCRSTDHSSTAFFVKPSRWWSGAGDDSGKAFFNKRCLFLLWSCQFLLLLLSPLAGRGGMERGLKPVM